MFARRSRCARAPKYTSRSPRLLRSEQLESRTVFAASSLLSNLHLLTSSLSSKAALSIIAPINRAPTIAKAVSATMNSAGKTATLSVLGSDDQGELNLIYTWKITSTPAGGSAIFNVNSNNAAKNDTITFTGAGDYGISVTIVDKGGLSVTSSLKVTVTQTLTSILVSPGTTSIQAGAAQQFNAQGLDQFQRVMATQPTFTWSANGGAISSVGLFKAPSTAGNYTIAVTRGSIAGGAKVTVTAPAPSPTPSPAPNPLPGGIKTAALGSLVQKLDADGSLSRADMIQILTSVGTDGIVDATELSDLKTILTNAAQYNMPSYVQVLAGDVVNGNVANAKFQGAALGNLAAGSSATQLNKLIGKWFLGTDHPVLTSASLTYKTASGSLFPTTPSHNDEFQGQLGDCYFISSLGTIADRNPTAIQNMFIDNGDGTFTVRFYGGTYGAFYNADGTVSDGFKNNACTADYVTVDRSLATYSNGVLAYSGYYSSVSSSTNSLWIPLAEKAYAQWNETGKEGRDGKNAFGSIEGGWMAAVDAQVLGHNATDYNVIASTKQAMVSALAANKAVTIGTIASSNSNDTLPYALYGSHAYAVTGYNASADLFTLYNPWGWNQPGVLSWSQLQATCSTFVVADATGSVPISGANLHAPVVAAASRILAAASEASPSPSASTNVRVASATWTIIQNNPTATSDTYRNYQAGIISLGSALEASAAEASRRPLAAGVDVVLASEELGSFFVR